MQQSDLMASVGAQKNRLPEIFGAIDFDAQPPRFTTDMSDSTFFDNDVSRRAEILARPDLVELMRVYTMQGDPTADAYAALMTRGHRLPKLIKMLKTACDKGIDAVPDAPQELIDLIHEMEQVPDWVDMDLVEEGARGDRNNAANLMPYVERGAFIGTFLNKYSALPMALTGTLSNESCKRRIFDSSNFLMQTTLPGGLTRYSEGFKATALVRMIHSMVRVNLMTRSTWDAAEYTMPIPQVDQMPAGLFQIYMTAKKVVESGRTEFNSAERARSEFARYRCYLLGLPENLLPTTPRGIVDVFDARQATLRNAYDDDICGPLINVTMTVDLSTDDTMRERIRQTMSMSISKRFFVEFFAGINPLAAEKIGFQLTTADRLRNLITGAVIAGRMVAHEIAGNIPVARGISDRILVKRMKKHLTRIGHADFVTDAKQYRPKVAASN
jgi:hypothetical protein